MSTQPGKFFGRHFVFIDKSLSSGTNGRIVFKSEYNVSFRTKFVKSELDYEITKYIFRLEGVFKIFSTLFIQQLFFK